jgi:hypothetical protein
VFHPRGACSDIIRDNLHCLFPVFVFSMAGDNEEARIPTDFDECVSRQDLEANYKLLKEQMEETIHKSVHDAFINMDLGRSYERLDRRLSQIVDRLAVLETQQQAPPPPPPRQRLPDDAVIDEEGNYDEAATRDLRLRRRLHQNTEGMPLMLIFNFLYHLFRVIMMLRDILVGR